MTKKILLSGIKPTGTMHIGNYFGAIKQFIAMQDEYDSRVFIADFHALTTMHNKKDLVKSTLDVTMDYLACGLDPEKVILFKQSDLPEVTELTWYFNCLVTVPFMERAHAYKDAVANGKEASMGLFDYPVLMASDILIQDADVVPVGQDQKQHVEYARDIAQKFNNTFGETFKLPNPIILKDVAIVPGTDGRKMSKSYGNTIPLFGTKEEIKKAVMSIVTDSKAPAEKKNAEECNIFKIHKLFLDGPALEALRTRYEEGGLGYKESKDMLVEEIEAFVAPLREKRIQYEQNPQLVLDILKAGGEKAKEKVASTMNTIKNNVGVKLYD